MGSKTCLIDDYTNCAGDTVTVTIDGTANVLTEAVDFTAETSNAVTCANLATAVDALTGVSASCSTATVRITKDANISRILLAEGDASCSTVANNIDGNIQLFGNLHTQDATSSYRFCFNPACTDRLENLTNGTLLLTKSSSSIAAWTNTKAYYYQTIQAAENVVNRYVQLAADATSADMATGNIFMTADGSVGSVDITAITNDTAYAGTFAQQVIFVLGGTAVNPSTVTDGGSFKLAGNWTPNTVGDTLGVLVMGDDDYIEIFRTDS
jgi:hypothetical protein